MKLSIDIRNVMDNVRNQKFEMNEKSWNKTEHSY